MNAASSLPRISSAARSGEYWLAMVSFMLGQLVVKNAHRLRQPVDLRSGQEAKREGRLERLGRPPRRFDRRLGLGEREPRMVEKDAACGCQFDAAHAARHQRDADLIFEVAHLAAERRLRGMQPLLGRDRQASLFGDRDEIAKMPELHGRLPYLQGMEEPTKSFSRAPGKPTKHARTVRARNEDYDMAC